MSFLLRHLQRYDWILLGSVLLLMALGLLSLFSLSTPNSFPYFYRQLLWLGIGLLLLVSASLIDFRLFRTQGFIVFLFYAVSVLILGAVLLQGFSVRGVTSWIKLGNILIQPAELAKLALIVVLAKFFSRRHLEIYRIRHLVLSALYMALPTLLVLLQPDFGSAIILILIWGSIVIFSGIKIRHFLFLLLLTVLIGLATWNFVLQPYQKARLTSFINPYRDPEGAGYQMLQAMIAVGSGKIFGKGLGYGSQSHLNFLPEAETDFIFAALSEEWGWVGTISILLLFFLVLWRAIRIGQLSSDNFSRLYTLGLAAYIFMQSFIHIGMNMGTLPITGLTLPFVSYGGSSLVTLLISIGILQNIHINARREVE